MIHPGPFEFATAGRIIFGAGQSAQLPEIVQTVGNRPLIVTGRRAKAAGGLDGPRFAVCHEPTIDLIRDGANVFRQAGCDCVVSVGGGSVIDAGKAIAAAAANPGHLLDYLEVIGRGQPLERTPHPFVAVPTTAGTGSEVTRNAVLGSPSHRVKVSLRSVTMLPRIAVVDPELTFDLPPDLTASTGLDALTQLIEPYVCARASALTDSLCLDGIRRVARSLVRAYEHGLDRDARADMCYASLLGGLALANAGLGVVHGFAAPIGGMFDAPHGSVCAALLAAGMFANIRALRERDSGNPALGRYVEVGRILTGDLKAEAEDGAEWVRRLVARLSIPSLGKWGISPSDVPGVVEKASRASSMKANPVTLTAAELTALIENSL